MRYFLMLLAFSLLLCGCSSPTPEPTIPTLPPETTAPTEPTVAESEPLDAIGLLMDSMSTEEKVGQLFLARCPDSGAIEDIMTYHLGGYILFGKDFQNQSPESLRQTLAAYQDAARIPLLIAVDEEGGTVTRVSRYAAFRVERFPSPRDLYDTGGLDAVLDTEEEKCRLLADLGINVNMAPVCDITTEPGAFMYRRSLGCGPYETGRIISAMVRTMSEYRVGSVLKHFPGYGNNTDTHVAMAVDPRTLDDLEARDLIPFAAGIEAGWGAVLVSHTIVKALDAELPASLSPEVHRYLREEMGFEGVIVTDDLIMDAISNAYGAGEAAVLAVLAGNDLLCSSEYSVQYEAVLGAVQVGRISQELLDSAVRRVLQWKAQLELL